MNVVITNVQTNQLANLDVDIIKSLTGTFDSFEIVEMFKNFFYSKMILDVTALKNYSDVRTYEVLVNSLDANKIIFLLPEGSSLCTPSFLSQLISLGIYNFTTNLNGINYLLKKTNTLQDVQHIVKMANVRASNDTGAVVASISKPVRTGVTVIGVKNITDNAGATTFIYLLKKELSLAFGQNNVSAIEIDKNDFSLFNDPHMISIKQSELVPALSKLENMSIILVDLNDYKDESFCADVLYLLEPSTIKLNRLVRKNRGIFSKLNGKKVILNKSLLLNNDVFDFENESGIKVFYNMPPLDERKRNAIINDFLTRLGLFNQNRGNNSGKIFGLFRR